MSDWERGKHVPSPANLADLSRELGVSEAALRYGAAAPEAARESDASEPAAPGGAGGLGAVQSRSMDFWEGRQSALLDMMQFAADLQRQAAEWQGRSIEAQREIIAATTPQPREITPAQQRALDDAEMAIRVRDAVRAEQQAPGARRRGERAG